MADVETISKQEAEEILDDKALAEEELLEELENEEVPAHIREARMLELQNQLQQLSDHKLKGYGSYSEISREPQLLEMTTKERNVVIHFYRPEFKLWKIVDGHLKILSEKHYGTKFAKVNVEKVPFCVDRLGVQMLPAILIFINSVQKDRIIGFEELGNSENFTTEMLEKRLAKSGVIQLSDVRPEEGKTLLGYERRKPDVESDEDDY